MKIVKTCEQWLTVKSMGTYEEDYKNGELWSFNGEMYYLSHLELPFIELHLLLECKNNFNV